MVPLLSCSVACVFASKHLWTFAWIAVVAVGTAVAPTLLGFGGAEEPLFVAVVVLVNEVGSNLAHFRPEIFKFFSFRVRTAGAHNLDVGVLLAHLLHEGFEVFGIDGSPLLVANTYILEVEGGRVSHVGTEFCPRILGRVTIGKLNEVEHVVDVGLQLVNGHMSIAAVGAVLKLTGETYTHDGQWLCTNLFGELEVFEEAKTIGLEVVGEIAMCEGVVPTVLVQWTILHGTYRVFPLITCGKVGALHNTSAWETEHAWVQLLEALSQVFTHTVLVALIGVNRKEAHMFHVGGHFAVAPNAQMSFGKCFVGLYEGSVFLPLLAAYFHADIAQLLVVAHGGIIDKVYPKFCCAAIGYASPHGEAVFGTFLHAHAEETVVLNHGVLVVVSRGCQAHVVGVFVEGAIVFQCHFA